MFQILNDYFIRHFFRWFRIMLTFFLFTFFPILFTPFSLNLTPELPRVIFPLIYPFWCNGLINFLFTSKDCDGLDLFMCFLNTICRFRVLLRLSGESPLFCWEIIKFSRKEFIFHNCCSKLLTFVHNSLSSFLQCGDWYCASWGAGWDTGGA